MFAGNAVAIEQAGCGTRILWLKGSPGRLQIAGALHLEKGENSIPQVMMAAKASKIPIKDLSLGMGAQAATIRYNMLPPVPDWRLDLIMKYELEEMVQKAGEQMSGDWRQLDLPESEAEDRVLIVALGKDQFLQPCIDEIEGSGGRVHHSVPHSIALYHAYRQAKADMPQETVLLVDIGASESQLVLAIDGRLAFARSVNYGGDHVDEAIADHLGLDNVQAKKLKEKLGGKLDASLAASAQPALRSCFGQFLSMVKSSVTFCKAQTKISELEIDRILISGGGAALPGLSSYIQDGMSKPVELHTPKIAGNLPGPAHQWVTAIGIAAAHLGNSPMGFDLLPAAAKAKRKFRNQTVWMYASAAVLLLALLLDLGTAFKSSSDTATMQEQFNQNKTRRDNYRAELQQAEKFNKKVTSQIDRGKRAVADGSYAARMFSKLQNLLPVGISFEKMSSSSQSIAGATYLVMAIEGRSDNSERKGLEYVQQLQSALLAMPEVSWVKADPDDPTQGYYPFKLEFSPDAEPSNDSVTPRRNRRSR